MRIAITGSSGLIGSALTRHLRSEGHEVVRLVRRAPRAADEVEWHPRSSGGAGGNGGAGGDDSGTGDAPGGLGNLDAAVNLAGAPIAGGRWTDARKHEILASRVASTKTLATMLASLQPRPAVLLSGSGINWYGDTGDHAVDESGPAGSGFLAHVTREWEASTAAAQEAGIRVVRMRTGIVLSKDGGMLGTLRPLFRIGLGARLGAGTQFMSWITLADLVEAMSFMLAEPGLAGPVNLTAPNPVTNAEFTTALARALGRRALLRVPSRVLDLALGEAAGELLVNSRVLPTRLLEAGYVFKHPDLESALAAELRAH
ncbi:MAG: TIGR01777 family oxidoreductase [Micromonosporaceae bacterium]